MNYAALFNKFYDSEIRYLLCGGLAVNLYGVPRMTADIDIILDFEKNNLDRFQLCINELKYQAYVPVQISHLAEVSKRDELIKTRSLIGLSYFNHDNHYLNLDVVLHSPLSFDEMWSHRVIKKNKGAEYYLVSMMI